ncbi:hypothetical protein HDV00_004504 [Rhizophlyctis rosea]|nr:hypothetical protein HDV00_004504 [Rhizophlyctis rosea]
MIDMNVDDNDLFFIDRKGDPNIQPGRIIELPSPSSQSDRSFKSPQSDRSLKSPTEKTQNRRVQTPSQRTIWTCPDEECCCINYPNKSRCFQCGEPRVTNQFPAPRLAGSWICPNCWFTNSAESIVCEKCHATRPPTSINEPTTAERDQPSFQRRYSSLHSHYLDQQAVAKNSPLSRKTKHELAVSSPAVPASTWKTGLSGFEDFTDENTNPTPQFQMTRVNKEIPMEQVSEDEEEWNTQPGQQQDSDRQWTYHNNTVWTASAGAHGASSAFDDNTDMTSRPMRLTNPPMIIDENTKPHDNSDFDDTRVRRVTFKDPLHGNRIRMPVKGEACTHFECFDLLNYAQGQLEAVDWRCPVCGLEFDAEGNNVVEDRVFGTLLEMYPEADSVLVHADGTYSVDEPEKGDVDGVGIWKRWDHEE